MKKDSEIIDAIKSDLSSNSDHQESENGIRVEPKTGIIFFLSSYLLVVKLHLL